MKQKKTLIKHQNCSQPKQSKQKNLYVCVKLQNQSKQFSRNSHQLFKQEKNPQKWSKNATLNKTKQKSQKKVYILK